LALPSLSNSAETKFSMELWNRYTNQKQDGETLDNSMALKRGYFRIEPKFSDRIKGRFNLDFFSDHQEKIKVEDTDGNSHKLVNNDGVGVKLKYAYLDIKTDELLKDSKISVGLIKNYFGTIYDWSYQTIEKDVSDRYKVISSTDYGIAFYGFIPNGYGEYSLSLIQGEGYKHGYNASEDFGILANIRAYPIPGLTVGGSFLKNGEKPDKIDDEKNPSRKDITAIAGVGRYVHSFLDVTAQYVSKTTEHTNDNSKEDLTSNVISIMPIISMKEFLPADLDLIARYDIFDYDSDNDDVIGGSADNSDCNTMIIGTNWNIQRDSKGKPCLMLQANYEKLSFDSSAGKDVDTMMLQLRWKFSAKIK